MKSILILLAVILMEECSARPPVLNEPWAMADQSPRQVGRHRDGQYLHVQCSCRSCVDEILVIALTSDLAHARSDGDFQLELTADGESKSVMLPDLPGDDYMPDKVDLFPIEMDSYGFGRCVKPGDIDSVAIEEATNDGWNIQTIIVLECLEHDANCFVLTLDFDVFRWVDGDEKDTDRYFKLELSNSTKEDDCLDELVVVAITSDLEHAGSDETQKVEIKIRGETFEIPLPDLPGDDFMKKKGDLWRLGFTSDFEIGSSGCVTVEDVEGVAILSGSNDGWNIESIITMVCKDRHTCQLATMDMHVERWIDGDEGEEDKRFDLTLV